MDKDRKLKRKAKIRRKIFGTADCPRLTVYKSLKSLGLQAIDDNKSKTICGAWIKKKNKEAAIELSQKMIDKLKENKIDVVKFDRNGYIYHGTVKVLADEIRAGKINF